MPRLVTGVWGPGSRPVGIRHGRGSSDAVRHKQPPRGKTQLCPARDSFACHVHVTPCACRRVPPSKGVVKASPHDPFSAIVFWCKTRSSTTHQAPFFRDRPLLKRRSLLPQVVSALAGVSGPFSFVYWVPERRALYYGRDAVGRRSLVIRRPRYCGRFLSKAYYGCCIVPFCVVVRASRDQRMVAAGGCMFYPSA